MELAELGSDDNLAVRRKGIIAIILAVVVLGLVEGGERLDFSNDGRVEDLRGAQFLDARCSSALLLVGSVENDRAILGAHIRALTIQRGRVMRGKKNLQ